MDYAALEAAINQKTKAIIPVDLGGIPCDYERIFEIVERKKAMFKPANEIQAKLGRVAVVADAAHAFGAEWHGQMVGSIADFTNFSFHAVKNFTTAEGGAMTWKHIDGIDDEAIYKQAQLLSLHGQSKDSQFIYSNYYELGCRIKYWLVHTCINMQYNIFYVIEESK